MFNTTDLFYIFLKDWKNALIINKISKQLKFEEA